VRKEIDVLFSQIEALFALERKLALPQALPPLRGWAGSPDFLRRIANEVEERKPRIVLECSSGISTLVVARSLQMKGDGHVFSLEHDPSYATNTRKLLEKYNLSDWATVLDAPLEARDTETPWYREDSIPKNLGTVDMLIIDGPPSTVAPLARFPALPRLLSRMSAFALIIMDDANRDDERYRRMRYARKR
jgi:predicted O-methyltransferase YrrM